MPEQVKAPWQSRLASARSIHEGALPRTCKQEVTLKAIIEGARLPITLLIAGACLIGGLAGASPAAAADTNPRSEQPAKRKAAGQPVKPKPPGPARQATQPV